MFLSMCLNTLRVAFFSRPYNLMSRHSSGFVKVELDKATFRGGLKITLVYKVFWEN